MTDLDRQFYTVNYGDLTEVAHPKTSDPELCVVIRPAGTAFSDNPLISDPDLWEATTQRIYNAPELFLSIWGTKSQEKLLEEEFKIFQELAPREDAWIGPTGFGRTYRVLKLPFTSKWKVVRVVRNLLSTVSSSLSCSCPNISAGCSCGAFEREMKAKGKVFDRFLGCWTNR